MACYCARLYRLNHTVNVATLIRVSEEYVPSVLESYKFFLRLQLRVCPLNHGWVTNFVRCRMNDADRHAINVGEVDKGSDNLTQGPPFETYWLLKLAS